MFYEEIITTILKKKCVSDNMSADTLAYSQ